MLPILFRLGGFPVTSYAVCLLAAFAAAFAVRRRESRRLGFDGDARHRWLGLGALVGAVVGSKVGMALFQPAGDFTELLARMSDLDFAGKTVVGGIAGGYLGVEITKKLVGINHKIGDSLAVAVPLGQAIGRIGCFLNGCCYGAVWPISAGPWAARLGVEMAGARRHPAQLYEAAADLCLAALLFATRHKARPAGNLFRRYLVGYALTRFFLEPLRGDASLRLGPLTLVQIACAAAALGFTALIITSERRVVEPRVEMG